MDLLLINTIQITVEILEVMKYLRLLYHLLKTILMQQMELYRGCVCLKEAKAKGKHLNVKEKQIKEKQIKEKQIKEKQIKEKHLKNIKQFFIFFYIYLLLYVKNTCHHFK